MTSINSLDIPVLSPEAIQIAIECLDWEEASLVSDRNWSCFDSERLAVIHIAKQQFHEYSKMMSGNFGALWKDCLTHENAIPLDKEIFGTMVNDLMKDIYGEYLPSIEQDYNETYSPSVSE